MLFPKLVDHFMLFLEKTVDMLISIIPGQIFLLCLKRFIICAEKVCYKLCNKNFLVGKEKIVPRK